MQQNRPHDTGKKEANSSVDALAAAHARCSEAEALRRSGKLGEAHSLCQSLLDEHPAYVGALQTLGAVQLTNGSYQGALSSFTRAAMHCPKDWINLNGLATVYLKLGASDLAAITLDQALLLNPDDAGSHHLLGEAYRDMDEPELAAGAYRKALSLDADHVKAARRLGECLNYMGRIGEAAAVLKQAHELRPDSVGIIYALSQLPGSMIDIDLLAAVDGARRQEGETDRGFETAAAFTRAAALDRKGRIRDAWALFIEANKRKFPNHEKGYQIQLGHMERSRQAALSGPVVRNEARSGAVGDSPLSLFIVGVSRSGKTTLERLVSELDGVKRGYENRLVRRAARRTSQLSGLLTIDHPADLPRSLDARFCEFYAEELREAARGARIFTATSPAIIHSAGRLAGALPDTRFIFVKREPNDTALRIFMRSYDSGHHYAYAITTIFEYLSWYQAMIDIWVEKLPGRAIVVQYEDVIADPAGALAQAAELCGARLPKEPLPELGDDQGCSEPYREYIAAALSGRSA